MATTICRIGLSLTLLWLASCAADAASYATNGVVSIPLVPHHVQKARRLSTTVASAPRVERPTRYPRRHLIDDSFPATAEQVAGLLQGYGTHYADLWCGTPPQRQTVIVDTGSGVTAFPCSACSNCGVPDYHIDELFQEKKSSTFETLTCKECLRGRCMKDQCSISQAYQEGSSWNAFEARDLCYVGGMHNAATKDDGVADDLDPFHAPAFAFPNKFGCQTRVTGLFKTQLADGIMGMDVAEASFWKQMFKADKIAQEAFSLCFSRSPVAAKGGTVAGAMSLGGRDERLSTTPMLFCSTAERAGFFNVDVRAVYLRDGGGGDSALSTDPDINVVKIDFSEEELNRGRIIVDSGTTDSYFPRKFAEPFKKVWVEMTGKAYSHGAVSLTKEELDALPTILFQLIGDEELNKAVMEQYDGKVPGLAADLDPDHPFDVILAMPPSHYFEFEKDQDAYISRFYLDEGSGGVLGANAMMGHDVYFDVGNKKVGWAESSCDYVALAGDYFHGQDFVDGSPTAQKADFPPPPELVPPREPICTTMTCQISVIVFVVTAIALLAMRLMRRTVKDESDGSELPSGLELQVPGEEFSRYQNKEIT